MPLKRDRQTLPDAVFAWCLRHRLVTPGETVLVAVSGGPDSVALCLLLQGFASQWHLRVCVAHVHHGVRGAQANRDQQFVETLAARLRLPCVCERLSDSHSSVSRDAAPESEEALREARYEALLRMARHVEARTVAVGHTLDDHAETVLMRLVRGAGVEGLQGIPVQRPLADCRVVRPLRGVWRSELHAWLRAQGEPWREDETNHDSIFLRNRVRKELLPLLAAQYNPQIKRALRDVAEAASALTEYVTRQADDWLDAHAASNAMPLGLTVPLELFLQQPKALQQAMLRQLVRRVQGHLRRFTYQHWLELEDLLATRPFGAIVDLPGGVQLQKLAGQLEVRLSNPEPAAIPS